jgi:hypothetical protein
MFTPEVVVVSMAATLGAARRRRFSNPDRFGHLFRQVCHVHHWLCPAGDPRRQPLDGSLQGAYDAIVLARMTLAVLPLLLLTRRTPDRIDRIAAPARWLLLR